MILPAIAASVILVAYQNIIWNSWSNQSQHMENKLESTLLGLPFWWAALGYKVCQRHIPRCTNVREHFGPLQACLSLPWSICLNASEWLMKRGGFVLTSHLLVSLVHISILTIGISFWKGGIERGCARHMTSRPILWVTRDKRGCARHITSTQADLSFMIMVP